jgi:LPS export ABC transporter protein LptC
MTSITEKKIIINIVTVFTVTMFFSCKNNLKQVQNMSSVDGEPLSIAHDINTKYTNLEGLKMNLKSDKMLDFSNREFAFFEFPEGLDLDFFDEESNKSNVIADYGLVYNSTNLIDLRGNVVLTTYNNDTLFAKQLYFDQNREWLFTNLPVRFRTNNEIINGNGFDSNSDFTNAEVLETFGIIYIDE